MERASAATSRIVVLQTPGLERLVPDGVFDAFGWCTSDTLEWRSPSGPVRGWDGATPIDGSDPARMVFVMRAGQAAFLPRELARLHAFGLGLEEDEALAPWAIDDATDDLYAHRLVPRDALWLAADNLNALFWGLHDWAHFHNHGAFEQRAWTELQCDASALVWMWMNRKAVPLGEVEWERARGQVEHLCRGRFEGEGLAMEDEALGAARLQALSARLGDCARTTRS